MGLGKNGTRILGTREKLVHGNYEYKGNIGTWELWVQGKYWYKGKLGTWVGYAMFLRPLRTSEDRESHKISRVLFILFQPLDIT